MRVGRPAKAKEPTEASPISLDDLVSSRRLAEDYADVLTEPGLRWLIRQRHRNGLAEAGAVLIVRRRAFLVRSRFEKWLSTQALG